MGWFPMASRDFEPFKPFVPYTPAHAAPTPWGPRAQQFTKARQVPMPDLPALVSMPGGGGTTSFIGRVVSGSGANYRVTIYDQGPQFDSTIGDVNVTILMIDSREQIPAGTWISPIMQFTDGDGNDSYFAQVPVWMD